jgi:hypothetical protein
MINKIIFTVLVFFFLNSAFGQKEYQTAKPWTYWWWMGSAVNKTDIKKQLVAFEKTGLGGVHIIPIYGVKGFEDQFKSFLSEEWFETVQYTIREAEKLNLGVDITLGTGWPYGGSQIDPKHAAKKLVSRQFDFPNSDLISINIQKKKSDIGLIDVIAVYASDGKERIDLTPQSGKEMINQKVTLSDWMVTVFGFTLTEQLVKRAAPGGEGLVMDYFDDQSVMYYLNYFDSIFSHTEYPINPRALYHDSYEVYRANWTGRFLDTFKELQEYDLFDYLYVLEDGQNKDYPLIVHDVRETLSEFLYSQFTRTWTQWSNDQNKITRNQAHGSPGNLLDLYALADIPETESFGCSDFDIPGLECDQDYEADRFGRPSPLMMKFASSPAHLLSKPLVSSETATWLADHFKVSLKQIKPQIDELFTAGINHIFYHGITYSPENEGFPGWLFYASTNFGLQSHFWDEFPLLNSYIENCQRPLQEATADNDILLYFPINDIWANLRVGKRDILYLFDVHHYEQWFSATSFGEVANLLWGDGFAFDYISDKQIGRLKIDDGKNAFINNQSKYRMIVVPGIEYIPESTIKKLKELADLGTKIIFEGQKPVYFSGFPENHLDDKLLESENFIISNDLIKDIKRNGVPNEEFMSKGLDFIRKKNTEGYLYFVSNLGNTFISDSIRLSVDYNYLIITDPISGKTGFIKNEDKFYLNVPSGKSLLIQTTMSKPNLDKWKFPKIIETVKLNCDWKVTFENFASHGLKKEYHPKQLNSWTDWGDQELKTFTGKARYSATFELDKPFNEATQFILYIEDVRETAKVIINGVDCGTIWCFPNQLEISTGILQKENKIEIVVQNLSSNYMKKYDKENPDWKKFYDINFVNITYDPFSTSKWDYEPSGIIGSIHLSIAE